MLPLSCVRKLERWEQPNRYQTIGNLKNATKVLNFLTVVGLNEKIQSMFGKQFDIRDELKKVNAE